MTARKILVACVCIAALGTFVAIPYALVETAGHVCVAAGVLGALGALSAGFRKAMERAERAAERLLDRVYTRVALMLLLVLPAWMLHVLPEDIARLVVYVYCFGALWSLATGWLSYKIVRTLLGSPAAA